MPELFDCTQPFVLESGRELPGYHLAYTTAGSMNPQKDNVVWIFHALTANSDPSDWWAGLVGTGKLFDPERYFIVCVNMPGSCYGSIGPLDQDPAVGAPFYHSFPVFTPRDMIRAYQPLRKALGIGTIHIGIGGSMGGQQLLEWAVEEPGAFDYIFPIATNGRHSPWGIAFNASQRFCIALDPSWTLPPHPASGLEGMKVARSVALLSYRHYETYRLGQSETDDTKLNGYNSESYQRYQGEKLASRFNAFSYYVLSGSMDAHNLGRGRNGLTEALQRIRARTLVIGITTDQLFPLSEQEQLSAGIPGAQFRAIYSAYGHDGFLLEFEQIEKLLSEFLEQTAMQTRGVPGDSTCP